MKYFRHLQLFRHLAIFLLISIFSVGMFFLGPDVLAQQQGDFGIAEFEQESSLGNTDIRITIARIINTFLGIVSIIVLLFILYAGFTWMTAGGNDEKIGQAKKMIINAVIGLVIVLSSWGITRFLLNKLEAAINNGGVNVEQQDDEDNNCQGVACQPAGGGNDVDQCLAERNIFVVKSISPNTSVENDNTTGHKDIVVRVVLSEAVGNAIDADDAVTLFINDQSIQPEEASFIEGNNVVELRFSENDGVCAFGDRNNQESSCLKEGSYRITVNENLRSQSGNKQVRVDTPCGKFPLDAAFRIEHDALDQQAPSIDPITVNQLNKFQVGDDGIILRRGQETDIISQVRDRQNGRGGIGYVHLEIENLRNEADTVTYVDGPLVKDGSHGAYTFSYGFQVGRRTPVPTKYTLALSAADLDGNSTIATSSVIVVGENCQNGVLDEGEIDIDIGGACLGMGRCEQNWECASQRCVNNQCVAAPIIDTVLPAFDGAEGNFITIVGNFFGEAQGQVFFDYIDNAGNLRSVNAQPPQCDAAADTWTDTAIIVAVPGVDLPINSSSSIRVVRAVNLRLGEPVYEDSTTDARGGRPGPFDGFFVKNETQRPGLCQITDRQNNLLAGGRPGTDIIVHGKNLGNNRAELLFGRIAGNVSAWQNERIFSTIPNMNPEQILVSARVGEVSSNPVALHVQPAGGDQTPDIIEIDPVAVTPGSLVTLTGQRFGDGVGSVYIAADTNTVRNCANNPNACRVLDAQVCGDSWEEAQIVVGIPDDIAPAEYAVLVRTQDGRQSNGEERLRVNAGAPLPSICGIQPNRGTAPLGPDDEPLLISGRNFSNNPTVFYWTRGALANNLDTWLSSAKHRVNGNNVLEDVSDDKISTRIPEDDLTPNDANNRLDSMRTGPIKVQNAQGLFSNGVRYTISDCQLDQAEHARISDDPHPLIEQGYRCCIEGPDAGVWQQNGQLCEGEERTSGYVWRFTTGIIPQIPDVVEVLECRAAELPSPSPWSVRNDGGQDGVCLNAVITARFTLDMNPRTLNSDTVKVFTCGNGNTPVCGDYDTEVTDQFVFEPNLVNRVQLNHIQPNGQFSQNTWYRVVLSDDIRAQHNTGAKDIAGNPIFTTSSLRVHNNLANLPEGSAYYFDFQTGDSAGGVNGDGLCQLIGADIDPPLFTAHYLGKLQDPRFPFDPFNLQQVAHPLYYTVLGRADQACLVLDVSKEEWRWDSSARAIATTLRDNVRLHKATVTALQDSQGQPTFITADIDINGNGIRGTSTLQVNLGEPRVIQAWPVPDCQFSCSNISVGVRFNRPMMEDSYKDRDGKHRLLVRECVNADCLAFTDTDIQLVDGVSDRYIYQTYIGNPEKMSTGTWYLASIPADILSIGRVDGNAVFAGESVAPYQWKFRIKPEDPFCQIARVEVQPDPFSAQLLGQKTRYGAMPISAPDQCSSFGQRLNPWGYGWRWDVRDDAVATVSAFSSQGDIAPYCTAACIYRGSTITKNDYAQEVPGLCGNGRVEAGEDCDIAVGGEVLGQTCTIACLRPGSAAATCGNGQVEPLLGEECDQGGDKALWQGCSASCTNTGVDLPVLCGDGALTRGEDCDGGIGCSDRCFNEGTPIAERWCSGPERARIPQEVVGNACLFANSVCGDGLLDKGEECEIIGDSIRVAGPNGQGVINIPVPLDRVASHCSASCLLQNICALNQVPHKDEGGIRCAQGDVDCRQDCHIIGSSVQYDTPSLCSDGVIGIGEYAGCELPRQANPLGQNPFQVVTAIGEGVVNPDTNEQETTISAVAERLRDRDGVFTNINPVVSGAADYRLMCGHIEQPFSSQLAELNVIQDADMESAALDAWVSEGAAPFQLEKLVDDAGVFAGARSLEVTVHKEDGGTGVFQKGLAIEGRGVYRVRFAYRFATGTVYAQLGSHDQNDQDDIVIRLDQADNQWHTFDQSFFLEEQANYRFSVFVSRNDPALGNLDNVSFLIDDVEIRKEPDTLLSTTVNTCGVDDNSVGVANNSCCAKRPARAASYPIDGDVGICRNTRIDISFRNERSLDEETLQNNIVLAQGFADANHDCVGTDVTARVGAVLAAQAGIVDEDLPFFERFFAKIKSLFARLFGRNSVQAAALYDGMSTWCSGEIAVTPAVAYEWAENDTHVTSTISLSIGAALEPNAVYAVVLRGGVAGIKNDIGVSIRGEQQQGGRFDDDDFISFRTGADVCRLRNVTVDPASYIFTAPLTTSTFIARSESSQGNQEIQPIRNIYDWEWRWAPQEDPIFAVPVENTPTNTQQVTIGSRQVEGRIIASGQAVVIEDQTNGADNHKGRIFSGSTELTASFCERPWPEADKYPYTDDRFNFSFSYCADAGLSGFTEDDLPYFDVGAVVNPEDIPGGPESFVTGTLQRLLFFNDQNDDVLGLQIFENPQRLSARDWFNTTFAFGADRLQELTIDGYDAVSDGKSIYVNALNVVTDFKRNREVYNNIYVFSLNVGAQPSTQVVFDQIIESLLFNTNVSDIGYCLSEGVDANVPVQDRRIPRDDDPRISAIAAASISCRDDFDCRDFVGAALDGTNGICSQAKTKFVHDWQRLAEIRDVQEQLSAYEQREGSYPNLQGGTFIPGYTNSRWPSWGRLSGLIGGIASDPVNEWSACGRCQIANAQGVFASCVDNAQCPGEGNSCLIQDESTCWDAVQSRFICPQASQITEYYSSNSDNYTLHAPLEYFTENDAIVAQFIDTEHYSSDAWCQPGDVHSPFAGRCGDGVVNIGESCDPPGSVQDVACVQIDANGNRQAVPNQRALSRCTDACQWEVGACEQVGSCGNGIVDPDELCDDGALNGRYGQCDAPGQHPGNPALNLGCRSVSAAGSCGNGVLDFADANNNGRFDGGETTFEFCDEVGGVCQFILDNNAVGEPVVYFLIEHSGSMQTVRGLNVPTNWAVTIDGMTNIAQELEGKAKIGIALFRGVVAENQYPEILPVGFYTPQQVRAALLAAGNPNALWTAPLGSGIDALRNRGVFSPNDPVEAARPKSFVVVVDGPVAEAQSPNEEITQLLSDGVYTYVLAVQGQQDVFVQWAELGGTDTVLRVDEPEQFRTAILDITACQEYALRQSNSCSLSCQNHGGFCGDGVTQGQFGEQCDDGNTRNGDGCNALCQGAAPQVNPELAGRCGDGIVQSPNRNNVAELCDNGDQNGIACTAGYEGTCNYCSVDCREVLTADSVAYCGNGVIDLVGENRTLRFIDGAEVQIPVYEACDVITEGGNERVITSPLQESLGTSNRIAAPQALFANQLALLLGRPATLDHEVKQCFDTPNVYTQRGDISCNNDCRSLVSSCVTCGLRPAPGATPNLAILNVIENPQLALTPWGNFAQTQYLLRRTSLANVSRFSVFSVGNNYNESHQMLTDLILNGNPAANNPAQINPRRLEANTLCTDAYHVAFNIDKIARVVDPNTNYDDLAPNGVDVGAVLTDNLSDAGRFSLFPYPVQGEGVAINNELVVSPAVPQNHLRIVVRYDVGGAQDEVIAFTGNLFNQRSGDVFIRSHGGRLTYTDVLAQNGLCNRIRQRANNESLAGYWMPDNCSLFDGSTAIHNVFSLQRTVVQSMTVNLAATRGQNFANRPIAFFVGAIANANNISISEFANRNVRVEIYEYQANQIPAYSLYTPDYVFELKNASGSNNEGIARYWHPFNIVFINGQYRIYTPEVNGAAVVTDTQGIASSHGSIETDYADVLCNVPGQACNRDR